VQFEVSVIIPVYNAEQFLLRAVESALHFECVKEVLLIEDGSKDNSLSVCKKIQSLYPERVKLFQHADGGNRGAGETRNVGLKNAQSNFIAFLDADDYFLENRFEKDKEVFSKYADADGSYNALGTKFENEDVKEIYLKKGLPQITTVTQELPPEEVKDVLLGLHEYVKGYFSLDTLTLKKQVLKRIDGFTPALRLHQDTEWLVRLSFISRLYPGEIKQPVAMRTVHTHNRITNFASINSRLLLNQFLFKWMTQNKVEKKYQDHVRYRVIQHLLAAEKSRSKRVLKGVPLLLSIDILTSPKLVKLVLYKMLYS
jgi:glycosyltransferase involved in cell wall biosynthesis